MPDHWTQSIYVLTIRKSSKTTTKFINESLHIRGKFPALYSVAVAIWTSRLRARMRHSWNKSSMVITIRTAWESNITTYMCFIDYTKRFQYIRWRNMLLILGEIGISRHLIWIIKKLSDNNEMQVRQRTRPIDFFHIG